MDIKEFEEAIKGLDRNKYHVGRSLSFSKDGKPYVNRWVIFRKDMSIEECYDPSTLAVLSSDKGNTIGDIKELIEREKIK
jgi:hypothetical protein